MTAAVVALVAYRLGLAKLVNSLTWQPRIVPPHIVPGSEGTLLRVNLRDLAGENFVQFHRRGAPDVFDACVALCGRAGFTPRIVYEANLMAAVLTLVESGLGASLVPAI